MGMGAFSNLFQGQTPNPWIGGLGLLTFNSLYIYVAFRAFAQGEARGPLHPGGARPAGGRDLRARRRATAAPGCCSSLCSGSRRARPCACPHLRPAGTAVAVLAGAVSCFHDGWGGLDIAYATWISTMVTAAIMRLSEAVRELRAAREELARRAVEKERLRFSRDLHDLLGHTMSVIVVKSEAARRLAARDLDAALAQITDIEAVGRQALTEIREAVTGYRQGSLATELDRARSALTAAGVTLAVTPLRPTARPADRGAAGLGGTGGGHQCRTAQRGGALRDHAGGGRGQGAGDCGGRRGGDGRRGRVRSGRRRHGRNCADTPYGLRWARRHGSDRADGTARGGGRIADGWAAGEGRIRGDGGAPARHRCGGRAPGGGGTGVTVRRPAAGGSRFAAGGSRGGLPAA